MRTCISISEGDTDKKRTKHIAKHFHFVKEKRAAAAASPLERRAPWVSPAQLVGHSHSSK